MKCYYILSTDDPTVIDDLKIDKTTLSIRWGIISDMNLDYTQSITIQYTSNNTNSIIMTISTTGMNWIILAHVLNIISH